MSDPAPEKTDEKPATAPASGKLAAMLPTIIAVVLAPVLSYGVVNFLVIPKLTDQVKTQLTQAMAEAGKHDESSGTTKEASDKASESEKPAKAEAGAHGAKEEKKPVARPKFENLTVNIAGTQGTRYLKVTFNVVGKNESANTKIDQKNTELIDVSLTILSSLTLPELDDPSSKSVVRGRLLAAFNELLKAPLVEQVYFSDFVVQ